MGKRMCIICGRHRIIFSKNRCYWCARKSYTNANEKDYGGLVNKLDKVFSKFIRLSYSDEFGYAHCYTSGIKIHWKSLHAGHFIDREHMATRWDITNVYPQSFIENVIRRGNLKTFRINLVMEMGEESVLELEKLGRQTRVWKESELKAKIDYYTNLVKELENERT